MPSFSIHDSEDVAILKAVGDSPIVTLFPKKTKKRILRTSFSSHKKHYNQLQINI